MDHQRIDVLSRTMRRLPSRRDVVRGLIGAGLGLGSLRLADAVEAKKKRKGKKKKTKQSPPAGTCVPKCGRKVCGDDGCGGSCGGCAAGQVCASGTCCTPEPVEVTCAGRCGPVKTVNTCGQTVACTCADGRECLSNSSCGATCNLSAPSCPGGAPCGASADGPGHCYSFSTCDLNTQACTSTAECPLGYSCAANVCESDPKTRCWPLA